MIELKVTDGKESETIFHVILYFFLYFCKLIKLNGHENIISFGNICHGSGMSGTGFGSHLQNGEIEVTGDMGLLAMFLDVVAW